MSVIYKPDGKPSFSDDHEYTSVIWALSDGADVPFSDYFDDDRLYGVKLDKAGYARLRAIAAIYIQPHLKQVYLEKIDRTLYWGYSTLDTAETLVRILDLSVVDMRTNLAPDHVQWTSLCKEHGAEAFASISTLRKNFPVLLKEEGCRIAEILRDRGASLQESKKRGSCRRGDGMYDLGTGALYTVIAPLLNAAIAELTGTWPEREPKPGDGFRLTFVGTKLVDVEPQWIDLSFNEEGVWLKT
jgi:hypothetical protein